MLGSIWTKGPFELGSPAHFWTLWASQRAAERSRGKACWLRGEWSRPRTAASEAPDPCTSTLSSLQEMPQLLHLHHTTDHWAITLSFEIMKNLEKKQPSLCGWHDLVFVPRGWLKKYLNPSTKLSQTKQLSMNYGVGCKYCMSRHPDGPRGVISGNSFSPWFIWGCVSQFAHPHVSKHMKF